MVSPSPLAIIFVGAFIFEVFYLVIGFGLLKNLPWSKTGIKIIFIFTLLAIIIPIITALISENPDYKVSLEYIITASLVALISLGIIKSS